MEKRKFKIGDKVRIVNARKTTSVSDHKSYIGKETTIAGYISINSYLLDNIPLIWFDDELEHSDNNKSIFDEIVNSIVKSAKNKSILVEPLENGGFKVTPIEEEKKENQSGIYIEEDEEGIENVYVVFGGGILVANGECHGKGNYCIGFQELDEVKECGTEHNESWKKNKPAVHLIINNKKSIEILREALNRVEEQLNKED